MSDGWLGLEVGWAAVINNNNIRLDHFMDNTDRALVTSVMSVTVDTLFSHNHRAGSAPHNMTNFVTNFKVSLRFPDQDNFLPHSATMMVVSLNTTIV